LRCGAGRFRRNRHCPKCQGGGAGLACAREANLLPVGHVHLVFTLPAEIAPIAYQNKAVVYDLLFRTAAETYAAGRLAFFGKIQGLRGREAFAAHLRPAG
jgi:hypothetical protein